MYGLTSYWMSSASEIMKLSITAVSFLMYDVSCSFINFFSSGPLQSPLVGFLCRVIYCIFDVAKLHIIFPSYEYVEKLKAVVHNYPY